MNSEENTFYWNEKKAENEDKVAQNKLAFSYEKVVGTEKNLEKALYWYKEAAKNECVCTK